MYLQYRCYSVLVDAVIICAFEIIARISIFVLLIFMNVYRVNFLYIDNSLCSIVME